MKRNMGSADRGVRLVIAAVVAFLFITGRVDGIVAMILAVVAGIFLLTSLVGNCPLYSVVGVSTCKTEPGT